MTEPEIIPPEDKPKRPGEFTDEIFQEVCDRMAGGEGLRKICEDPQMPSRQTFLRWIEKDTGRQSQYQAAREALMDWYSEEILAIAWDDSKDTIKREGKPDLCNHEWINRSRLKVDTLKFLMAKLHPKRYGDKLTPEAEAAANINVSWEPTRIERVIIDPVYPRFDAAGNMLNPGTPEYEAAGSSERERAFRNEAPQTAEKPVQAPAQITYNPTSPPADLSPEAWSRITRVSDLIEQIAPSDEMPEHVFGLIEGFLRAHYLGETSSSRIERVIVDRV